MYNNVQILETILLNVAFTIRTVCREYSRLIKERAKSDTMIELNLAICKSLKSYKIKGKLLLKDWNPPSGCVRKGCIYADELNRIIKDTTPDTYFLTAHTALFNSFPIHSTDFLVFCDSLQNNPLIYKEKYFSITIRKKTVLTCNLKKSL